MSPAGSVSSIEPAAFLTGSGASSARAEEIAGATSAKTRKTVASRSAGCGDRIVGLSFRIRSPVYVTCPSPLDSGVEFRHVLERPGPPGERSLADRDPAWSCGSLRGIDTVAPGRRGGAPARAG